MIATISSGYDSAACAALARDVGCDTAITYHAPQKYAADSGEEIALGLGYPGIITKNADRNLRDSSLAEAEFASSGEMRWCLRLTAFEDEFAGQVFVTGVMGDTVWDKIQPREL
ncbi:MAG: hypothetical protein RBR16_06965 [Syntrophus sp. (in: bacteria)]|nr:hypothetical protein [Syntrophus sp. (in: bacteria)]